MNITHHKFAWLLRREIWENKGGFVWAPLAIGALLVFMMSIVAISSQGHPEAFAHFATVDPQEVDKGLDILAQVYPVFGAPILILLMFTVFFYSLGALFDERKDHSIMFWKSLPVSDPQTVASKALVALIVAPLIAVCVVLFTAFMCLLVVCMFSLLQGINLFGVFANTDTYLTTVQMLGMVPFYALSALPTVGWLMLVGSIARSKPFLWALLIPIGIALGGWVMGRALNLDTGWTGEVAGSLLLGTIPGSWLVEGVARGSDMPMHDIFTASVAALGQPLLWLGVGGGLVMLTLASYMRRRGEEL